MKKLLRTHYLNKLKPFMGKPVVKILVGMRRVGKSELLCQIEDLIKNESSEKQIVSVNKELRQFDFIKTHEDLNRHLDSKGAGQGTVVLVDEVQEIESWEKSIASYLAEGMDLYITGSNAHMLSTDLATHLSGRYVEFPVFPLSFSEFCDLHQPPGTDIEQLTLYLRYGGLPGIHLFGFEDGPVTQYLDAVYQSILLKDVVKRHNIRNVNLLENVTRYLFDNIGNLFSATNVSKFLLSQKLKNSLPTVQAHVRQLCDALLAFQVRQYDLKGKRHLEIHEKYYAADLGLRHAIVGFREDDISGLLENLVYVELLRRDFKVSIGRLGKYEVDFVGTRGQQRVYIQVTYLMPTRETLDREFSVLERIPDNHPKYVLSLDPITHTRSSGVRHLNIITFLKEAALILWVTLGEMLEQQRRVMRGYAQYCSAKRKTP